MNYSPSICLERVRSSNNDATIDTIMRSKPKIIGLNELSASFMMKRFSTQKSIVLICSELYIIFLHHYLKTPTYLQRTPVKLGSCHCSLTIKAFYIHHFAGTSAHSKTFVEKHFTSLNACFNSEDICQGDAQTSFHYPSYIYRSNQCKISLATFSYENAFLTSINLSLEPCFSAKK